MKNTGILLLLIGVFIFINSNNFAGVFRGKYSLSFLNPKETTTAAKGSTLATGAVAGATNG